MQIKITVVGSTNMDLTTYAAQLPKKGETVFAKSFELGFGGKGANQAVAAARLGAEVTMVTKVGEDYFGMKMLENFKRCQVRTEYITRVAGVSSGVAIIIVDEQGNNSILVAKGANEFVDEASVNAAINEIKTSDILLLQLEIPIHTVYHAIAVAEKHGVTTLLNPAPAAPLAFGKLKGLSTLVLNEVELGTVLDRPVRNIQEVFDNARRLVNVGIPQVVVTLGEDGAALCADNQEVLIPTLKVTPVDTTGAGDAFIGSLAVFLAQGRPIEDAVQLANYYAAFSTLSRGTQKSYLTKLQFVEQLHAMGITSYELGKNQA